MRTVLRSPSLLLNTYQPLRRLGSGGMGETYLGKNVHTGIPVVIKFMHAHLAQDSLARKRFAAERDIHDRFRHPFAVTLLDADLNHTPPFLVQELVDGITLEQLLLRQGPLPVSRVLRLAGQLCQVLHAMHNRGILHRDLSAANIMLVDAGREEEKVKLMDFGLASLGASGGVFLALDRLAGAENSIGGGTPDYLCPEQIRKEPVDQRGDLYSLGVLLFQMMTGQLPFQHAASVPELLEAHLRQAPPAFQSLKTHGISPRLESAVRRLLDKQPAERPTTARDVVELLSQSVGFRIAPPDGFEDGPASQDTMEGPCCDDLEVLDRFDAWMPEQIAIMKLRGFLQEVGGEVVSSLPGKICVRILDPRVENQTRPGGLLGFLGFRRPALSQPRYLHLELLMEKRQREGRNLVELSVVLEPGTTQTREETAMRRGFGERICRELRAYLMV